jgi:hypothetical protein
MGPIILFDKSFLQSLSVDESVWFDHFFLSNICPLFYVETLADLEKHVREGRTVEQEVAIIASKFPQMSGWPCAHHINMCTANLAGHPVPMTGQVPIAGGRPVRLDGKRGVVFRDSPEAEAFRRWQQGEFMEIERLYAAVWRQQLSNLDLREAGTLLQAMGIDVGSCKSLEDAKGLAADRINTHYRPTNLMKLSHLFLSIPWESNDSLFVAWRKAVFPSLATFAPYASFALTVELFFQIALASQMISSERTSNRVDIAYLLYLPFCMIFVSSDRLHRRCAPLFLRSDQEFVWGMTLKEDLSRLNDYYSKLPDSVKEQGIHAFAGAPPEDGEFLVARLWDRYMRKWRDRRKEATKRTPPAERAELLKRLKAFQDAPAVPADAAYANPQNIDMMSLTHYVTKRKGSWWQVGKDIEVPDDQT